MSKKQTSEEQGTEHAVVSPERVEQSIQGALRLRPKGSKELRQELGMDNRELSRTLQRLRRRGALQVLDGRWALTSVQQCPECEGRGWIHSHSH